MRFILLSLLCLSLVSNALAAPKITEIRLLEDEPTIGFPSDEFVFRADGNFYWVERMIEEPIRHRYPLDQEKFQKLAGAVEVHHFFDLQSVYPDLIIPDAAATIMSVTRGRTKKSVSDNVGSGFRPRDLWELQMILRGCACDIIGQQHTPARTATRRIRSAPMATPIPIIRGTQRVPN